MAQDGDTITYSFSGSKVTEDISDIDEITIVRMDGADGSKSDNFDDKYEGEGGSGGLIQNATADVSSYSTLEIWVGETQTSGTSFGRSNGGFDGIDRRNATIGKGGGSTELLVDGETEGDSAFIAAADGGAGGSDGIIAAPGTAGGAGGVSDTGDAEDPKPPRTDSGFGGDGAGLSGDGEDGGQVLGIASGGTTTTGGSTDGNGEITVTFTDQSVPTAPSNLSLSLQ